MGLFLLCMPQAFADNRNSCGFSYTGNASLRQMSTAVCNSLKSSSECQNLYKDLKSKNIDVNSRALNCTDKNLLVKSFEDFSNFRNGCASGGWNFVKDSFISVGTFIGESAAKAKMTYDSETAENKICDADPNGVKRLYDQHNKFSVKALQIALPSAAKLKSTSCLVAKLNIKSGVATRAASISASIALKKAKKQALNVSEKEFEDWHLKNIGLPNLNLQEKAKQYIKEQGIKLQCYNARSQAEMLCEAIGEVASMAVGGAGVAVKGSKAAKLAEMSGVSSKAVEATKAAQAGAKLGAATAAELATAAKLSNVQRVGAAEGLVGRALTQAQKNALIDAHEVAANTGRGFGSYTTADLSAKARILESAGFSKAERELLMRRGIAGVQTNAQKARTYANTTRLEAERARATNNMAKSQELYKQSATAMETFLKDTATKKTARDYADAVYLNQAAGDYDKAAKYMMNRYNMEFADVRDTARRNEMIFDRMRQNKADLRKSLSADPRNPNRLKYFEDEKKLIEAFIQSGQIKFTPSHLNELRR